MRLITPIVTLATLASTASAARNKDNNTRTNKKRTIFHKVNVENNNDSTAKQALLENVKAARRSERRDETRPGKMELHTDVKMEDLVKQRLSRRKIKKQKQKKEEGAADAKEVSSDGRANTIPSDPLMGTTQEMPKATATSGLRSAVGGVAGEAFEFEEFDESTATSAPLAAPSFQEVFPKTNVQEVMQKRRKDRAAELVHKKERRATSTSNNTEGQKRGRRAASSTPDLTPNPRPRRKASAAADKKTRKLEQDKQDLRPPRPGYDKRDLKKSKKSSNSGSTTSTSKDGNEKKCEVRLTNLTKNQWFSDIFWVVHSDKLDPPLFTYGERAFDDLALLAQDGDPRDLVDYYEDEDNDDGVLEADSEGVILEEGESLTFEIPKSGSYDLLTMATSFMFANDGFVAIEAGDIEDEAEWYLWGIDAGVEANTQLCWTVQAESNDFPFNSECSRINDDVADENDNSIPGEGFVFVHAGIHDLLDRGILDDFLAFTCDDVDADNFVEYFREFGFDDDYLLYDDDRGNNERSDDNFLEVLEDWDDVYNNYLIAEIAVDAGSFKDFCDELDDIDKSIRDDFATLEPQVFDFRTPMMHVELEC